MIDYTQYFSFNSQNSLIVNKISNTQFNSRVYTFINSLTSMNQQLRSFQKTCKQSKISKSENIIAGIGNALAGLSQTLLLMQMRLKRLQGQMNCQNKSQYGHKQIVLAILQFKCKKIQILFKELKKVEQHKKAKLQKLLAIDLPKKVFSQHTIENDQSRVLLQKLQQRDQSFKVAHQQLHRIQQLLNDFGLQLDIQKVTTQEILLQSEKNLERIKQGNKQIKQAQKRRNFGRGWAFLFIGLAISLLILDILI